jgi:hypothetical protein
MIGFRRESEKGTGKPMSQRRPPKVFDQGEEGFWLSSTVPLCLTD